MVLRRTRSLARTSAHTAVAVGTMNALGGRAGRKQQAAAQQAAAEQAAAAPVAAPPVELPSDDIIAKLERLAALRDSGALSEEEFATLKSRALAL